MKLTFAGVGLIAIATLFAGCKPNAAKPTASVSTEKPNSVALVPVTERSSHFAKVNSQLELGGSIYAYVDIDGDVLKLAPALKTIFDAVALQQPMAAPFLKQDPALLLKDLGLDDVKAFGVSSVHSDKGGFRNTVYLHTPAGRHGLLATFGGAPASFSGARLAPADADIYVEGDVDINALYSALRALVARVAGEPLADMAESQLQRDQAGLGFIPLDVIKSLKGRVTFILRTSATKTFTVPGELPVVLPAFELLIRVDGLGTSLGGALSKIPDMSISHVGTATVYSFNQPSPIPGIAPVLAVDQGALYLTTGINFLTESLTRKDGLSEDPKFLAALAELGEKGNGVTYVSPRLFDQLRRVETLNPQFPAEVLTNIHYVFSNLPSPKDPLVAVRLNLPEGVLYRSRWHRSLKQDVAMVAVYNPVAVGLLAAMAIPAFQKVRATSQDKAITNNLRQLHSAAQQYMLENGVDVARYSQLVGPSGYIRELKSVDGEDYTKLVIRSTDEEIVVTTRSGKRVSLPLN